MSPSSYGRPKVNLPGFLRWRAVIRLDEQIEIWFAALHIDKRPDAICPILCHRRAAVPVPKHRVPEKLGEILAGHLFDGWPHRFFWCSAAALTQLAAIANKSLPILTRRNITRCLFSSLA